MKSVNVIRAVFSIIATIDWRKPVRIEATTIAVITPTTIPRIVRNERNLFALMLSSDIRKISNGRDAANLVFNFFISFSSARQSGRAAPLSKRVKSGDNSDNARNDNRHRNITDGDGHRDFQ
jgi:hypothetical protein